MKQMILGTAALAMILTAAMTAAASEWNFYGNARIGTFYEDTDNPGGTDTTSFNEYLHGNSRIGAKVRVSDQLRPALSTAPASTSDSYGENGISVPVHFWLVRLTPPFT